MIDNFFTFFLYNKYISLILIFVFFICCIFWNQIFTFFNLKKYKNFHRIHEGEIPRLGGFFIFTYLIVTTFYEFNINFFIKDLLISSIPFFLISLKEDLFHNTKPKIRLISMIISSLIFFYIHPINFPIIDMPYLDFILNNYYFSLIFYIFSILVLMNGMNLIDGLNGLFGLTAIFQLIAIIFIAHNLSDIDVVNLAFILLIPLLIFLVFNFPFGYIFAGDFGAYFYGFAIGLLTIYLFGRNSDLLSWSAVLFLFYPCMELIFSFIRKVANKINPLDADQNHLHTLLAKNFSKKINNKFSNPMATIFLFIFWLLPITLSLIIGNNLMLIIFSIFIFIFIYLFLYSLFMKGVNY